MHKMHHRMQNDNWIKGADANKIFRIRLKAEAVLTIEEGAQTRIFEFNERHMHLNRLPKNVRLLGGTSAREAQTTAGMYEFEVVTGNAAYKEGERFYLTQAQAENAYFSNCR